jgi:hypothetical protein
MDTTLATKQDLLRLASKEDVQLLRQNVALLSQEVLGIRELLNRQTDSGFSRLDRSIDAFRDDMKRNFAAFERGVTIKFGSMFYGGCGLMIAAMRL